LDGPVGAAAGPQDGVDRGRWTSVRPLPAAGGRRDDGFTLVEILTVVIVIGVLLLIGIPAFLGARSRANDRSAQVSLRQAFTNAKTIYADTDSYAGVTVTALTKAETSLAFTAGDSWGPGVVSVDSRGSGVVLAALSQSGVCFAIGDAGPAGTVFQNLGPVSHCVASAVSSLPSSVPAATATVPGGGWARAW
jgi:prepilin-type N-terminal cleavage/methylation domain-containing protein